ncbi:MAG: abortive infection family protein [Arthrobacter sp.]|nr:abortive infection family protein [Arthrobacter sp.]
MSNLSPAEKATIKTAFNKQGYVLDFSDASFARFTVDSIGYDIKSMYGLSKGASLDAYIAETETANAVRLTNDLLDYYEGTNLANSHPIPANVVEKLRQIIQKYTAEFSVTRTQALSVRDSFEDSYTEKQINQMLSSIESNPADSIGKAKELLETCLKSILLERGVFSSKELARLDLPELIKATRAALSVSSEHQEVKQIIGGLSGIASGIAQLRNTKGSGHGRPLKAFSEPTSVEARLAVDSCVTLVHFFWSIHKQGKKV